MFDLNIDDLKKDIIIKRNLRGFDLEFNSTWGLFSPEKIDNGTELIINHLEIKPNDISLDLGCGYGAIGLVIACLSPQGRVHLVDKDFVAVKYAEKNSKVNHLNNCEIYLSNGFSHVPDMEFDNIVSNLPAKVSKELFMIMFNEAKSHLKKGGKFYVVTVSGLREFIKRSFKEIFGNYEKLSQANNYTVGMAFKE